MNVKYFKCFNKKTKKVKLKAHNCLENIEKRLDSFIIPQGFYLLYNDMEVRYLFFFFRLQLLFAMWTGSKMLLLSWISVEVLTVAFTFACTCLGNIVIKQGHWEFSLQSWQVDLFSGVCHNSVIEPGQTSTSRKMWISKEQLCEEIFCAG